MKIIALLLILCLSFNVLAANGTLQELEHQIDDYQFTMTVEWDQKDQAFYEAQTNLFIEKVEQLINEQGLTKKEITGLVEKKMNNKQLLDALKLKLSLMPTNLTPAEMFNVLKDHTKGLYSQGASWNGEVMNAIGGVVVVLFIIAVVVASSQYVCVEYGEKWKCSGQTYADGSYTQTCGWESVCTEYEKKD